MSNLTDSGKSALSEEVFSTFKYYEMRNNQPRLETTLFDDGVEYLDEQWDYLKDELINERINPEFEPITREKVLQNET